VLMMKIVDLSEDGDDVMIVLLPFSPLIPLPLLLLLLLKKWY